MYAYALFRHYRARLMYALMVAAAIFGTITPETAAANLLLDAPVHGSFTTAPQIVASGRVEMADLAAVALTINGTVVTLAADGAFSHPVALDAERIFNPVWVELSAAGEIVAQQRPVVIVGTSLPATALAPESLAVRLTNRGLDQLALLVVRSVDLDVARFIPPGPLFSDKVCVDIPLLPDICTDVDVTIDDNPAPHFGAVEVALDAAPDRVNLALTLRDLFVRAKVASSGASCTITVTADSMLANGAIRLEPSAANPAALDVVQAGDMTITFGNFDDHTDCGGVLGDVLEEIVKLLVGNIQDRLQNGLENFLNTVDAAGNTPMAGALEDVMGALSLEAAINPSLAESGLQAHLLFNRISEDSDGITFVLDTAVDILPEGPCTITPDNPAIAAVYDVPRLLPVLGSATLGGLPFDAGVTASATVLNQALRGATACGLLQAEFTEVDINGSLTPITAGLLAAVLPEFAQLDPTQPILLVLRPTLSPMVSGTPGPAGEQIDLRVPAYLVELSIPGETSPLMQAALDLRAGIDLRLDPATGAVQPMIGDITAVSATLLINSLGVAPAHFDFGIKQILIFLSNMGTLNDALEPIVIPALAGLDFEIVDVSRLDAYLGAFVEIMPQP